MKLNKSIIINSLVTIFLLGIFVAILQPVKHYKIENLKTRLITIKKSDGTTSDFIVEVAETPKEQAKGLMFRKELAKNSGMLFVLDQERVMEMWMKNTYIPLDILFIGADGKIKTIAKNATPNSLKTITSGISVIAVLEINAMLSDELNIRENDLVLY